MWSSSLAILAFVLLSSFTAAAYTAIPSDILSELTPRLSPTAKILLPSSSLWPSASKRWNELSRPSYSAIIQVAEERDIAESVKYANQHQIPFFAFSQTHGSDYGLGRFHGIGISLSSLNRKIDLDKSGRWATIGGGMKSKDVLDYLWKRGKQTGTGGCGCVGAVSPALGGGHNWFQGQYGLMADQVLELRVVLADGEVVVVNDKKHKELFWGMRGAGHNFGIVSEMKYRVYDVKEPKWSIETFTFKSERLEEVYKYANKKLDGKGDPRLLMWGTWFLNPAVDAEKPVVQFQWIYNGPFSELKKLSKDTHDLKPDAYSSAEVDYPELSPSLGYAADQYACQTDGQGNRLLRGIDVDQYDVKSLRKWYDAFAATLMTEPAFQTSFCILEGYSTQAVQAVPDKSTAFALRGERLLFAPAIFWQKGNATLDEKAKKWSREMYLAASGSSKKKTYVNYAHGDEPVQALYGYEPWRLKKLKQLKKKYDPLGHFAFFNPVNPIGKRHGDI
ncbi:uncharacterized protein PODANS_7_890 [Podospora anserina S mat+]|uniref:FAD-dependent oxygenase n=1 Tax=Podospora anserina (strain S / ATCC MYA-4624 / DSM 980 / FGSC 10383) TaxID=515849 RepID=B2ANZ9_PODAN|nr:uncharacterized protein PODANS_7_890 [Podospora anserina S mat+]CAP65704.1 unnamed protein product [Podospora anserina S mat+]CDP32764.1 Putative FAD-dependent oxygenase [Podospora anserina S mat+]